MTEEVYILSRQVDGRSLISGVYRDREDAVQEAKEALGEYDSDSVNAVYNNSKISVFTGGECRCVVYPFELR